MHITDSPGHEALSIHNITDEQEGVSFGDTRLDNRSSMLIESLAKSPQSSINASFNTFAATVAAYRFFSNEKVKTLTILSPHRQQSTHRASDFKSVRLIQDTSQADYSNLTTLKGAGPLASRDRRGVFLHAALLVAPGGLPLGVRAIDFIVRKDEDHGKSAERKQWPIEKKESFRWLEGYRDACLLQSELPGTDVISVSDREADMYEIFAEYDSRKSEGLPVAHYVNRAKEDRVLLGEHKGRNLFELSTLGEPLGIIEFEVPAQKQHYKEKGNTKTYFRKKRMVRQEVRAHRITPRPPLRKGRKLPQVTLWVVMATEIDVPKDQRPINWRILTSKETRTLDEARDILEIYLDRWQIEVFFKTLKSGCRIEELKLKEMEALQNAIALYSIVAWRQLYMVHLSRTDPDKPCGVAFTCNEWEGTLKVIYGKDAPDEEPSLSEFILEVAKLGGYLNRKHDPPPGTEVLWKGLQKVEAYGEAWLSFKSMTCV
jgi:hypothetical protein